MRIYSMTATFGKLEHETLTLQPGLNIIEAPNEWGKSTWCAFLVAMLYGIESRVHGTTKTGLADKTRYDPWSGQLMSGRIELNWNGRDITIERTSTKRAAFRQFSAYETHTGTPVSELTADNCGQMLLGVEKEVYQRTGFLRLTDLPVTQSDALRRRLNALVTTGDESGAADRLADRLNKLKNECRANRSKGLLPQAEAKHQEISQKLQQFSLLQAESENIRTRQAQLEQHKQALQNHKAALEYEASREQAQRKIEAQTALTQAEQLVQSLEGQCKTLPLPEQLQQNLQQAHDLRLRQESDQMEQQMLPSPTEPPALPASFQNLSTDEAVRAAVADAQAYRQAEKASQRHSLPYLGLLAGLGLLLVPNWIVRIAGVVIALAGILLFVAGRAAQKRAKATAQALTAKYGSVPPADWATHIEDLMLQHTQYHQSLEQIRHQQDTWDQRRQERLQALTALTGGIPLAQFEQEQKEALALHSQLDAARRELQHRQNLVQAFNSSPATIQPPTEPDTLTHSSADTARLLSDCELQLRQLHQQQGRCLGQMDALGHESALKEELAAVEERIRQLQDTMAAIELAQQTLTEATEELQRRFAPQITQRTKELFSRMTGGRYDRISLSQDLTLQASAENEDTLRSSLWRSDGTIDQLYLSLRLAVADALIPDAPLVLDDALVRFDDTRLGAAMDILQEEAQSKQVVLFTCQTREKQAIE